eukprot:CAMPEP_0113687526 /NCGR_PEP_ID=MMETSP0038_2-20120614/15986_1 /TAXON_ID=2898 /ORGANISM="Cryptomonas paramecium" /LENGTH=230 /DNA_ID=CAMNT_0000608153 /DNA_START=78 /DNA_END=770 /DNA_ORIENTATION=+ /assembly_acc=CAM_ASM_000170
MAVVQRSLACLCLLGLMGVADIRFAAAVDTLTMKAYNSSVDLMTSDLKSLCAASPSLPGCSIWYACQRGNITGNLCADGLGPISMICSTAQREAASSLAGCKNYKTVCNSTATPKLDAACTSHMSTSLPTLADLALAVKWLCMVYPTTCTAANKFNVTQGYTIDNFAKICQSHSIDGWCIGWKQWCAADPKSLLYYCTVAASSAHTVAPSWNLLMFAFLAVVGPMMSFVR